MPRTLGRDYGAMIEKSDGFAQVFPEHKFLIVEALRQRGHSVGMTGDGVNDAPALKKADVGIAVEGATDAARAASDLVLTEPGLSVIVDAIVIARCIFQRMKNYVIYRVACTFQLLLFFFVAVFAFHPRQYDAAHQLLPGHPNVYPLPTADLGSGPGGGDSACSAVQCSYSDIGDFGSGTDDSTTCGGVQCSYGFRMSDTEARQRRAPCRTPPSAAHLPAACPAAARLPARAHTHPLLPALRPSSALVEAPRTPAPPSGAHRSGSRSPPPSTCPWSPSW